MRFSRYSLESRLESQSFVFKPKDLVNMIPVFVHSRFVGLSVCLLWRAFLVAQDRWHLRWAAPFSLGSMDEVYVLELIVSLLVSSCSHIWKSTTEGVTEEPSAEVEKLWARARARLCVYVPNLTYMQN